MAIVVISCTAIGIHMEIELSERVKALRELERFITMLKREIQYAATPLQEAFRELSSGNDSAFGKFFMETAQSMEAHDGRRISDIFLEGAEVLRMDTGLFRGDIEHLAHLGGRLGYLDREMQVRTIELYQEELAQERERAEAEYRKKAKVYRYLGFLGGCFLVVLLI